MLYFGFNDNNKLLHHANELFYYHETQTMPPLP